jgi:manganese efflux pump family protein
MPEASVLDYRLIGEYGVLSIIGFILVMDNFRVSIGLGILQLDKSQQRRIALSFGYFESVMPILGVAIGNSIAILVGSWIEYLGAITVGVYGVYLIYLNCLHRKDYMISNNNRTWMLLLFLLPLTLSLDNLIAGVSMGIVGIQLFPLAFFIGCITVLTSLAGMQMGGVIIKYLSSKTNILCGIILIAIATSLIVAT